MTLAACYPPRDEGDGTAYLERLGFPGAFPLTRGIQPSMYRGRPWTMRQYAGFATARETNRRYRHLLKEGQTGLSVAFDLPTQMGYDADHARARGEVGRAGVAISTVEDMAELFDGIPQERVSVSMTINATAMILLACYLAVAKRRGAAWERLEGTLQNDILKEYAARATYIFPPGPSLRLTGDVMEFCARRLPRWNPISVGGYHMREAGCTAAQEIAFTLGNGLAYVEEALRRGLTIEDVGPRVSFFFAVHNHWLEEIAKFRAARRLWARLIRERYPSASTRACLLRFHCQTAGSTLTAQQPHNNLVRVTLQALAAVLGGAQSLHTNSFDEALALPSEQAVTLALRTQQILASECGVDATADPAGGAYAVEALTDALEDEARTLLTRVEGEGGMVAAVESGWVKREIEEAAYRAQREIESGARIVVGVNRYAEAASAPVAVFRVPARVETERRRTLARWRARRSARAVADALKRLEDASAGRENLVPRVLEAVEAGATLGEVSEAWRRVFGAYRAA